MTSSFLKDERKKVLIKRGFILFLVLALGGLGIYGAYKYSEKKKRDAVNGTSKKGSKTNIPPRRTTNSRNGHTTQNGYSTQTAPPTQSATNGTNSSETCSRAYTYFNSKLDYLFRSTLDHARVLEAYQEARDLCVDFPELECNTKTLPELAKIKYEECCEEVLDGIMSDYNLRVLHESNLTMCISARASLDSEFSASTISTEVLCKLSQTKFMKELEAKNDPENTQAMWDKTLDFCPQVSWPNTLSNYLSKLVCDSFARLTSSDDEEAEAARNQFLELFEFWRLFEDYPEDNCYKSITNMASLKEYISNYQNFFQAYPTFKDVFEPYITRLNTKVPLTSDELESLRKVLPNITPFAKKSIDLPSFAEKEQLTAYQVLRKAIENNKGDLAERVCFEYYDDIIRHSILGVRNFNSEKNKACEAYSIMRERFEGLTKECYGDVEAFDQTCDFKLAKFKHISLTKALPHSHWSDSGARKFRQVFNTCEIGQFHILQITKDVRELLLWLNEMMDFPDITIVFKSLDYESNVTGSYGPFIKKFAEYAFARKEYITKEFKLLDESKTEHARLQVLFDDTKAFNVQTLRLESFYTPPPIAVPGDLPFVCSNADEIFVENFFDKGTYYEAAEACRPYKGYERTGIDGKKVTYDKFYEGDAEAFLERVFVYIAEKLRKLGEYERTDDQYTCHVSPQPLKDDLYKEKIKKLI